MSKSLRKHSGAFKYKVAAAIKGDETVAVMDWFSRYVLAWMLSNTLDVHFCLDALEEALEKQPPDIFQRGSGRSIHRHAIGPRSKNQHGRQGLLH